MTGQPFRAAICSSSATIFSLVGRLDLGLLAAVTTLAQVVHRDDHQEVDDRGGDQERDDRRDEGAPVEDLAVDRERAAEPPPPKIAAIRGVRNER